MLKCFVQQFLTLHLPLHGRMYILISLYFEKLPIIKKLYSKTLNSIDKSFSINILDSKSTEIWCNGEKQLCRLKKLYWPIQVASILPLL